MKRVKRWPLVALIMVVGAALRFWQLGAKPLWMDEVITGLFSFGQSYDGVPRQVALPITAYEQIFTYQPATTCAQITATVSAQSVHPPLFFCWMHQWLGWLQTFSLPWVWALRSLPALVGVGAIGAIARLNHLAFSYRAAWIGALVMAVSPFGVYLSQEARHYTLPMLLVTLALMGLYQMVLDLEQRQIRWLVWLGWVGINGLGFYVHYFFILAFVAQAVVLLLAATHTLRGAKHQLDAEDGGAEILGDRSAVTAQNHWALSRVAGAIAAVLLIYSPWLPTFFSHITRPETDWIETGWQSWRLLAPIVQLLLGWVVMVIALPVEQQELGVIVLSATLMAGFSLWLGGRVIWGLRRLHQQPQTHLPVRVLLVFTLTVVLEFWAIAYGLGKDLTQVPRYNFIYFPAVCALIGAGLSMPKLPGIRVRQSPRSPHSRLTRLRQFGLDVQRRCDRAPILPLLLAGLISSSFVATGHVFQKPYLPNTVAQTLTFEPDKPLLVVAAYNDFQDMALGLSLALPLQHTQNFGQPPPQPYFAFLEITHDYNSVWQQLTTLQHPLAFPLNLWVVAPGLKRVGYPPRLQLPDRAGTSHTCQLDPSQYYRLGIPYQLYRCGVNSAPSPSARP